MASHSTATIPMIVDVDTGIDAAVGVESEAFLDRSGERLSGLVSASA
jgi:hypothetical protein